MKKQTLPLVLLGVTVVALPLGCNSDVGAETGGGRFSSCYAIGFSDQNIADIYDSAISDRANGFTYYEESRTAAATCVDSCYYEAVCSNGCTSCAYEIIAVAYSKSSALPAKSSTSKDSAIGIGVTIKELIANN